MSRCGFLVALSLLALSVFADAGRSQSSVKDVQGDPLPPGALARFGSLRLRHNYKITFAAFLPGGKNVLSVGDNGAVCVWEFPSGKEIRRFDACDLKDQTNDPNMILMGFLDRSMMNAAALSPDGKTLATSFNVLSNGMKLGAEGNQSGTIRLHDVATGKEISVLKADAGTVTSLVFSPNGQHLSAWYGEGGNGFNIRTDSGGVVRIWDWAKNKEISKAAAAAPIAPVSMGLYGDPFGYTVFSPDGKTLMLYGVSNLLQFLDVATGSPVGPSVGHAGPVTSVWIVGDGKWVLTQSGNGLQKWDAANGKDLGKIEMPAESGIIRLISPDGRIGLTSVQTSPLKLNGLGGVAAAMGVAVKSQPAIVAIGGGLAAWAAAGKPVAKVKGPEHVLFDTSNGKELSRIAVESSSAGYFMALSANGGVLAMGSVGDNPIVKFFDVRSGNLLRVSEPVPEAGRAVKAKAKAGLGGVVSTRLAISKLLFSGDGKVLALQAEDAPSTVVLLETATGKRLGAFPSLVNGVSASLGTFTPDGRCLVMERSNGTVALVELVTGQFRRSFGTRPAAKEKAVAMLGGFGGAMPFDIGLPVNGQKVALSPDGRLLVHAGVDAAIHVWDVLGDKELSSFKGHSGPIHGVSFSSDGKRIASASADTTALLWDATNLGLPAPRLRKLRPEDADRWWEALASADAGKAFDAICDFADASKDAVTYISQRLKPASPLDAKRVEELIQQLDHNQFKVREKADLELRKLGRMVVPPIDKALSSNPPLESKKRLDDLRGKLTAWILQGTDLREYRAVETLERIGTPESRQLLQELAAGAPGAVATEQAQATLHR